MGFISYCMSLSLYIMSSCLWHYSVLMYSILQVHVGQRSMCGVIIVDAKSFRSIVTDVIPIYMIMPRYSHNYALFYQLLDSNSFTHCNTYAGPRVYFPSYQFPIYFILQSLLSIYIIKMPKIFILLSLSDLTFASGREGIDNPSIALVVRFLFAFVGTRRLV